MARSSLRQVLACMAAAAALAPSTALAEPVSDAKDLFARGRELRAHGDCASAVGLFRKAIELYPGASAACATSPSARSSSGTSPSSRRAWLDLRRWLRHDDRTASTRLGRRTPTRRRRGSRRRWPTLTIDLNVVDRGAPRGRDGRGGDARRRAAGRAAGRHAARARPGRHVVRVAGERVQGPQQQRGGPGRRRRQARGAARRGDGNRQGRGARARPGRGSPRADDDARAGARSPQDPGWIAIGVGAASLVGAGISLAVRQSALGRAWATSARRRGLPSSLQPTVSRGRTREHAGHGVRRGRRGRRRRRRRALLATTPAPASQARLVVTPSLGGASATWSF